MKDPSGLRFGCAMGSCTWSEISSCRAGRPLTPEQDFRRLEEELILTDLAVVEKRIERIELDKKRGKRPEGEEESLLQDL